MASSLLTLIFLLTRKIPQNKCKLAKLLFSFQSSFSKTCLQDYFLSSIFFLVPPASAIIAHFKRWSKAKNLQRGKSEERDEGGQPQPIWHFSGTNCHNAGARGRHQKSCHEYESTKNFFFYILSNNFYERSSKDNFRSYPKYSLCILKL